MRKRSPLRLSEKRGPVARYWICAFWIALCSLLFYFVVDGFIHGKVYFKLARGISGHEISSADSPRAFWFAFIFNISFLGLVLYLAVAEIIYTRNREKRARHISDAA